MTILTVVELKLMGQLKLMAHLNLKAQLKWKGQLKLKAAPQFVQTFEGGSSLRFLGVMIGFVGCN
jgi:hypothetical protein